MLGAKLLNKATCFPSTLRGSTCATGVSLHWCTTPAGQSLGTTLHRADRKAVPQCMWVSTRETTGQDRSGRWTGTGSSGPSPGSRPGLRILSLRSHLLPLEPQVDGDVGVGLRPQKSQQVSREGNLGFFSTCWQPLGRSAMAQW